MTRNYNNKASTTEITSFRFCKIILIDSDIMRNEKVIIVKKTKKKIPEYNT